MNFLPQPQEVNYAEGRCQVKAIRRGQISGLPELAMDRLRHDMGGVELQVSQGSAFRAVFGV